MRFEADGIIGMVHTHGAGVIKICRAPYVPTMSSGAVFSRTGQAAQPHVHGFMPEGAGVVGPPLRRSAETRFANPADGALLPLLHGRLPASDVRAYLLVGFIIKQCT